MRSEILRESAMPEREGPKLIVPDPYYVCEGCPFVLIGMNDETPAWCPLLPKSGPLPEGK